MAIFNLNINGKSQQVDVDPNTPMLWVLRDHLDLVGTKFGCGIAQCGACTIHMDGNAVRSCQLPVSSAQDSQITTIEGLAPEGGPLHPLQEGFKENHALHCGFCTPGMILRAKELLELNSNPTEEEIRWGISGNLCRCGTHQRIVAAVKRAITA